MKKASLSILLAVSLILILSGCQKKLATDNEAATNTNTSAYDTDQIPVDNLPVAGENKINVDNPSGPTSNTLITNNNSNKTMTDANTSQFTQATFKTSMGDITVKLYKDDSPNTVNNFIKLVQSGFYNGTKFHRVIPDFMIQGGDPLTKDNNLKNQWGTGGPNYQFDDEINSHKLVRGSLAMANAGPNTNGSQFFIVTAEATPWLDGKHTNFGEVTSGMDVVAKIEQVRTEGKGSIDRPVEDVILKSIELK